MIRLSGMSRRACIVIRMREGKSGTGISVIHVLISNHLSCEEMKTGKLTSLVVNYFLDFLLF